MPSKRQLKELLKKVDAILIDHYMGASQLKDDLGLTIEELSYDEWSKHLNSEDMALLSELSIFEIGTRGAEEEEEDIDETDHLELESEEEEEDEVDNTQETEKGVEVVEEEEKKKPKAKSCRARFLEIMEDHTLISRNQIVEQLMEEGYTDKPGLVSSYISGLKKKPEWEEIKTSEGKFLKRVTIDD